MTSSSEVRRARLSPSSSRSVMSLASFWMNSERVRSSVSSCAPRSASSRSLSWRVRPSWSTYFAGEVADLHLRLGEARLVGAAERAQLLALSLQVLALRGERLGLRLERLHLRGLRPGALADLLELARGRLDRDLRDALLALQLVLALRQLRRPPLDLAQAHALGVNRPVHLAEAGRDLLRLRVERGLLLLRGAPDRGELEVAARRLRQLELADLRAQRLVLLGLARLPVEALELLA